MESYRNLDAEIQSLRRQVRQMDVLGAIQAKISMVMYRMEQMEKIRWGPPGNLGLPRMEELQSRVSSLEVQMSDFLCCVCLNSKRDVVFNPCHHHVTCGACCVELLRNKPKCPICRANIDSYIKVRG